SKLEWLRQEINSSQEILLLKEIASRPDLTEQQRKALDPWGGVDQPTTFIPPALTNNVQHKSPNNWPISAPVAPEKLSPVPQLLIADLLGLGEITVRYGDQTFIDDRFRCYGDWLKGNLPGSIREGKFKFNFYLQFKRQN